MLLRLRLMVTSETTLRTVSATVGTVELAKASMAHFPSRPSKEWSLEIAMIGESLAPEYCTGDFGAAVFDAGGILLGLQYSGQVKLNTAGPLTYTIPIHAILGDIKRLPNGVYEARLKV